MQVPVIDTWLCTRCEGCIEISPEVFRLNGDSGLVEVADLPVYPAAEVDEAIRCCPVDCISWEEA